jgi:uncharacterized protein YyaL (SSP411 family)
MVRHSNQLAMGVSQICGRLITAIGIAAVAASCLAGPVTRNHLAGSRSAYLQRASAQPVDWYPWGDEAWRRAKELDRPVLLDVGAIWCSWCNLMDRESYLQPDMAAFINQNFIAIKVDFDADPKFSARLERAQADLNLPAGLPLTGFLTPTGTLYSGGGYFPAKAEGEKPAFRTELEAALKIYRNNRAQIEKEGFQVISGERK